MTITRVPAPGAWPTVADAGHLLVSALCRSTLCRSTPCQDATPAGLPPSGWDAARPAATGATMPPQHKPLDITLLGRVAAGLAALSPEGGHDRAVPRPEGIPSAEARDSYPHAGNLAVWPLFAGLGPLGALPTAPRLVRSFAALVLGIWGLTIFQDDTELVMSELATNAVAAATGPDGRPRYDGSGGLHLLWARLLSDRERLRLEVWDTVPEEMGVPVQRQAQETDESGRGLELLDALSSTWGWSPCQGAPPRRSGPSSPSLLSIKPPRNRPPAHEDPVAATPATPPRRNRHTATPPQGREHPMQHDALADHERASLERLKLAADVILAESDSPAVTDALEAELAIFRDRIERALLMPDKPKPGELPG